MRTLEDLRLERNIEMSLVMRTCVVKRKGSDAEETENPYKGNPDSRLVGEEATSRNITEREHHRRKVAIMEKETLRTTATTSGKTSSSCRREHGENGTRGTKLVAFGNQSFRRAWRQDTTSNLNLVEYTGPSLETT